MFLGIVGTVTCSFSELVVYYFTAVRTLELVSRKGNSMLSVRLPNPLLGNCSLADNDNV